MNPDHKEQILCFIAIPATCFLVAFLCVVEVVVSAWRKSQIRATNPYAFRSGSWAQIIGFERHHGRRCYIVKFPDGATDLWPVNDPAAGYELRPR